VFAARYLEAPLFEKTKLPSISYGRALYIIGGMVINRGSVLVSGFRVVSVSPIQREW
jgi:hypothetical protein